MKIIVLGSGVCVPTPERCQSSYYVQTCSNKFIFDMGEGALHRIAQKNIDIFDIDGVFFSHFHVDHSSDFVPFLFSLNTHPEKKREKNLIVAGPKGINEWIEGLYSLFGEYLKPKTFSLEAKEFTDMGTLNFGKDSIKVIPVKHCEDSVGFRLESASGKIVSYTGDSGYCKELEVLGDRADCYIMECSYPDREKEYHLNAENLLKIAKNSRCKKVVITHIYPQFYDFDFSEYFDGAIEYCKAEDLMEIEL